MRTYSPPLRALGSGSRRHRGRHVLRPLSSRMWAVFGAVGGQREPLAQNLTLHLMVVSDFCRVAVLHVRVASSQLSLVRVVDERACPVRARARRCRTFVSMHVK